MRFKVGDYVTSKKVKKVSKKNLNKVFKIIEHYVPISESEPTYRLEYYKKDYSSISEFVSIVEDKYRLVSELEVALFI